MNSRILVYHVRRNLVMAERAKGWQRRKSEREDAAARVNSWMLESGVMPLRTISVSEFRREYP